jgi:hypothetical protein
MSSTPYASSINVGSSSFNNYVHTPILAPLSTNQYPSVLPYHNYGILTGIRPTPPQFYPTQQPVYSEMNTNPRFAYKRVYSKKDISNVLKGRDKYIEQGTLSQSGQNTYLNPTNAPPTGMFVSSTGKHQLVSTHMNYIKPIDSSLFTNIKKDIAVGKSAYKVGLSLLTPITTKNYFPSEVRTKIKRVRSGGCVAPKKKGAIENTSLRNGQICAWGALPRQNY